MLYGYEHQPGATAVKKYNEWTYRQVEQTGTGWQKTRRMEIRGGTWVVELNALNWKDKPNRRIQRLQCVCDKSKRPESLSCLLSEQ